MIHDGLKRRHLLLLAYTIPHSLHFSRFSLPLLQCYRAKHQCHGAWWRRMMKSKRNGATLAGAGQLDATITMTYHIHHLTLTWSVNVIFLDISWKLSIISSVHIIISMRNDWMSFRFHNSEPDLPIQLTNFDENFICQVCDRTSAQIARCSTPDRIGR